MVLRSRKVALAGSLSAAIAAILVLSGPLSRAEGVTPCALYGKDVPSKLSKRHARMAVRCLVNRARERHGLHRLRQDHRLKRAAQAHTRRMRKDGCFDHECPGERSVLGRLQRVNYITNGLRRWMYGENIAYGSSSRGTPKAIVQAWMHSSGHRHNILTPSFRQIGVGFTQGTPPSPNANGSTFTTDFGMRKR
jgi:uncharacterized protein YkwD